MDILPFCFVSANRPLQDFRPGRIHPQRYGSVHGLIYPVEAFRGIGELQLRRFTSVPLIAALKPPAFQIRLPTGIAGAHDIYLNPDLRRLSDPFDVRDAPFRFVEGLLHDHVPARRHSFHDILQQHVLGPHKAAEPGSEGNRIAESGFLVCALLVIVYIQNIDISSGIIHIDEISFAGGCGSDHECHCLHRLCPSLYGFNP